MLHGLGNWLMQIVWTDSKQFNLVELSYIYTIQTFHVFDMWKGHSHIENRLPFDNNRSQHIYSHQCLMSRKHFGLSMRSNIAFWPAKCFVYLSPSPFLFSGDWLNTDSCKSIVLLQWYPFVGFKQSRYSLDKQTCHSHLSLVTSLQKDVIVGRKL